MNFKYNYRKSHGWAGLVFIIILLLISFSQSQGWIGTSTNKAQIYQPGLYSVSKFVDGDTIEVDMNGKAEKIRMIGVDTPETHKPNTPVQCYGPAAAAFTKNFLKDKKFRLESDSLSTNRDRYDRLLRYVITSDGINFNKLLIEKGYGFYYPYFPFTKSEEFQSAQNQSKKDNLGLWMNCQPTQNEKGGYQSNSI